MDRIIGNRFSIEEYKTLRTEQLQRIVLMNSQTSSLTTTILSTWGPVLTIFIAMLSLFLKNEIDFADSVVRIILAVALIIQSGFLTCAVLLMYPLSIKGRENLHQVIAIGAYIRTFYELVPMMREEDIFHWDVFHTDLNPLLSNKQNNISDRVKNYFQSNMARHYNDEIMILVVMSSLGACFTSVAAYILYFRCLWGYPILLLIGYSGFIVYKTCRICRIANTKHFIETETCEYRLHYLEKAKELKIITDDEYEILKGKIEFDTEVAGMKVCRSDA